MGACSLSGYGAKRLAKWDRASNSRGKNVSAEPGVYRGLGRRRRADLTRSHKYGIVS
jgi:hypothetical protein